MTAPSSVHMAQHIADAMDGEWDDGLEAFVSAGANGNGLHIRLSGGGGERIGAYRVIVEEM